MEVEGETGVKENSQIILHWPTRRKMVPLTAA